MRFVFSIFMFGILASCFASRPSLAATATTSFSVSATVQVSCNVSSAPRAFGTYRAVTEQLRAFDFVHCSNATPYTIRYDAGWAPLSADPSRAARRISLGYSFLPDAMSSLNRRQALGAYSASGTVVGSDQVSPRNSEAMGMRYAAPGSYVDTVIVTVIY